MTKIKTFEGTTNNKEHLDEEINKFIGDKTVKTINTTTYTRHMMSTGKNITHILLVVLYEE